MPITSQSGDNRRAEHRDNPNQRTHTPWIKDKPTPTDWTGE
jgi:hypothetical protein